MDRTPRLPLARAEFDQLEMPMVEIEPRAWVNLRFRQHANGNDLFAARPGARLTPRSMKIPCLYLAGEMGTSFMELYGDRLYAAKVEGKTLGLPELELDERVFVEVHTPKLRLCDLVKPGGAKKLNLDQGTLWAAELKFPQLFAEAIFKHPAGVDGILYQSRHTDGVCAVVWNLAAATMVAKSETPLRNFLKVTDLANCTLFDEPVSIAGTEETFHKVAGLSVK